MKEIISCLALLLSVIAFVLSLINLINVRRNRKLIYKVVMLTDDIANMTGDILAIGLTKIKKEKKYETRSKKSRL